MTKKDLFIGGWVGIGQLLVAARQTMHCSSVFDNLVFVLVPTFFRYNSVSMSNFLTQSFSLYLFYHFTFICSSFIISHFFKGINDLFYEFFELTYITFLSYNTKISDNNAKSGKMPRMLAELMLMFHFNLLYREII
jgi:hypothetical protein